MSSQPARPRTVHVGSVALGAGRPLVLIAGPCVIESAEGCRLIADRLARWAKRNQVPWIFKASFDKANRSSVNGFRGPGPAEGLEILQAIKDRHGVPILTDIHEPWQAEAAAPVADILQIPAFLCRQTDLLVAAAETGRVVNVKKGQFMAPEDLAHAVAKIESAGNRKVLLTERGTSFGYHNLVVDFRSLPILRTLGCPVVFDATHSVQRPGGLGDRSGGDSRWAPVLARAAVATGACDAVFFETHPDPDGALSDGANMIALDALPRVWRELVALHRVVRGPSRKEVG